MKRLLCRLAEYYLALCEDDIENGLPGWVRRHLHVCAHCQAELQAYQRTSQTMRQYASLLPDAPPTGWRPLQVREHTRRSAFPLQVALAPALLVLVALVGWALWHSISPRAGDVHTPPQMAQGVPQPKSPPALPDKKPQLTSPDNDNRTTKPVPVRRIVPPATPKPNRSPQYTPPSAGRRPPKRVLVAVQPAPSASAPAGEQATGEPSLEPPVPVQLVVVEAHPVASAPIPEGYVMESARPATTGAIE